MDLRFWLFKKLLLLKLRKVNPLIAYPFVIFVKFALDGVYKEGGLKAAKMAVDGYPDNWKAQFDSAFTAFENMEPTKPVKVVIWNSAGSEEMKMTFFFKDQAFSTASTLKKRLKAIVGKEDFPMIKNSRYLNMGEWLRPGDVIYVNNPSPAPEGLNIGRKEEK